MHQLFMRISDNDDELFDEKYFVKTSGCRIVKMDVMSEKIKSFLPPSKPKAIKCGVPPLTTSDEKYLWINLTEAELNMFYNVTSDQLKCFYASFTRVEDKLVFENTTSKSLNFGHRERINSEYIKVRCKNQKQVEIDTDYHSFFPSEFDNFKTKEENHEKFNVMILGIDSVSKLNLHRLMNKTVATIVNELNGIEMHGYNKIDDNTYPNLIPLLSGLSAEELAAKCLRSNASKNYFDDCNFIWKDFKEKGYKTLFSEDSAALALFNYFKKGFNKQPTDYYFYTMLYEMENYIEHEEVGNFKSCLGHRLVFDVFIKGYLKKFIKSMSNELFFSFFWTSSMTHDFFYQPMLIDDDISELLAFMKNEKYLQKTILFILSDHGLRFGPFREETYQGMVEERLPFLFTIFPQSFKTKYSLAIKNFKRNSRRLTTHYDVYETLKDLTNLNEDSLACETIRKRSEELMQHDQASFSRGISLFLEIPEQRTCDLAGIESHWCMCHEKIELPCSDQLVQKAAQFVVKSINDIIKPFEKCHVLSLDSILSAYMHVFNENDPKKSVPIGNKAKISAKSGENEAIYDITVKIKTKPGTGAKYEATVQLDKMSNNTKLSGIISRINSYTEGCVKDSFVEKYCYCG